jgi:hypothetical protein
VDNVMLQARQAAALVYGGGYRLGLQLQAAF